MDRIIMVGIMEDGIILMVIIQEDNNKKEVVQILLVVVLILKVELWSCISDRGKLFMYVG